MAVDSPSRSFSGARDTNGNTGVQIPESYRQMIDFSADFVYYRKEYEFAKPVC